MAYIQGCGGGAGVEIEPPPTTRSLYLKVFQVDTPQRVSNADVRYLTGEGSTFLRFKQVVASVTDPQTQIALEEARITSKNVQEGDYFLKDIPSNVSLQGIWIKAPEGFLPLLVRYTNPFRNNEDRVLQMPETPSRHRCLILTEKTRGSDYPLGETNLGTAELYPTDSVPPPPDDQCP